MASELLPPPCTGTPNQNQQQPPKSFLIRSLKQGSTGAVKTWPACEVLLEYLVRWGGLRDTEEKLDASTCTCASSSAKKSDASVAVLDMTFPTSPSSTIEFIDPPTMADDPTLNIVELGGGNGTLGVGLAMALNGIDDTNNTAIASKANKKSGFQPNVKIMCTDNDHRTVKNMRFNVSQQPKECKIGKAVRAESLDWSEEIGGEDFASRIEDQFGGGPSKNDQERQEGDADNSSYDPMQLVTHVVGSDIHFGHTTLDPLSSVIAAFKLRNPQINVTLLMKERNPENYADVADLATEIEVKVSKRLEDEDDNSTIGDELQDFSVSVRDVLHDEIENMKLLEC